MVAMLATSHTIDSVADEDLDISEFIASLEQEANTIFADILPISFDSKNNIKGTLLKKERWYIIKYDGTQPTYWNSNKISLDSTVLSSSTFPVSYIFGDDLYAVFKDKSNTFLAFRLANEGKIHSRLVNHNPELADKRLTINSSTLSPQQTIFTFEHIVHNHNFFLLLGLIASYLLVFLMLFYLREKKNWMYLSASLALLIQFLVFSQLNYGFQDFYLLSTQSILSVSASHLVFVLFIHLAGIVSIDLALFQLLKKLPKIVSAALLSLALFFLGDFFIDLSSRLVLRSAISFDFEKLFGLSVQTFVALAFILLAFISLWMLCYHSNLKNDLKDKKTWFAILIGLLLFCAFQYIDAHRSLSSLVPAVLLIGIGMLIDATSKKIRTTIYSYFLLTAIVTAGIVFFNHKEREESYIHDFAKELIANKDTRAEQILKSFENELALEFLTPSDNQNFNVKKDQIENRIKHLYFSNYLEKYELKLFSFGFEGKNTNQNNLYSLADLDEVYNTNSKRTASAYFYQIDNPISVNGYIAKYENCDLDGHYGTTFILLQPRVVQSEFLYPEVFDNQKSTQLISLSDYSYGLYFNNRLVSQKGSYPYQLNSLPEDNGSSIFSLGAVRHRKYDQGIYQVVLSKTENRIRSWLSSFTFTLLLLLPIGFFISLLTRFIYGIDDPMATAFLPGTSKYLSSRIQTSLTIILLLGLLLSVYIIITFIRSNYNQNLENQLLTKVKNISTRLQDKVDLEQKLNDTESRTLILNEESSTYNVDINLYNTDGKLLGSTKPYLNDNEILSTQMNPKAFARLKLHKSSQLLIQEELEGSDYLSAYVPLFDGKNEILGFLNTPFFAKNEQLNKQISNLVVNILNIYFLLLLGGILLAYIISKQISKPLVLIREKIAKTVLLGENELITYNRDDEIGQLVKQYNKMVMELEESANQMAETEREGAWREMAKQVAHEIKNPLTPMKLSVQHLQRAYDAGPSEKLDALFSKTSRLLIDQINSLSTLASEFGNFAQMPEDKFEVFDVSKILAGTADLFKQSENVEIFANISLDALTIADPEQIRRVFNNLIKNAIQAIPEGRKGKIQVQLNSTNTEISIDIKDNGKGIPKELYKKVFVPNFSTKNSGMGLGLAICRKIVESAGGKVSFVSEVDKGTTFNVTLPRNEKA